MVVVTHGVRFAEKVFGDVNLLGSMQCFELSRPRGGLAKNGEDDEDFCYSIPAHDRRG